MKEEPRGEERGQRLVHFGFKLVKPQEKPQLVCSHFESVARRYDFMNTLLSFGAHLLWKRWTVERLGLKPGDRILDLCGGTGDMAILAAKRLGQAGKVVLYDINRSMMEVARVKLTRSGVAEKVTLVLGDAERISFEDGSFDVCMVAFGIRNLTDMEQGLREIYRVLKPGGRMGCLEFSLPRTPWFRWLYDIYSFHVMPALGRLLAGSRKAYTYLPESIRVFPNPDELARILKEIGFVEVSYRPFTDGIAVLHRGRKSL